MIQNIFYEEEIPLQDGCNFQAQLDDVQMGPWIHPMLI